MQMLKTIKTKSQETMNSLLEKGKEQPGEVKTWGITAGGAVVGALAVTAAAKGVIAIFATIAAPPVAVTVGAVGGGVLGWNFIHGRQAADGRDASDAEATAVTPETTPIPSVAESTVAATVRASDGFAVSPASATPAHEEGVDQAAVIADPVTETVIDPVLEAPSVDKAVVAVQPLPTRDGAEGLEPEAAVTDFMAEAPPALSAESTVTPLALDNLEAINGIGPVYASRLQTAGIETFAQLAELTPDRIQEIIGSIRSGHMIEAEKWIAEARQFTE